MSSCAMCNDGVVSKIIPIRRDLSKNFPVGKAVCDDCYQKVVVFAGVAWAKRRGMFNPNK